MTILDKIVSHKRQEVALRKERYPVRLLEESIYFESETVSLRKYLQREDKQGIIAEIKRRSPSKGDINPYIDVEQLSIGYMQAGASALSVLTDHEFFGGKSEDLSVARKFNYCPILRKDFIIDPYQITEAKSIGADVILLIAACLTPAEVKQYATLAKDLNLEVLLEVHNDEELKSHFTEEVDLLGVNNRNLKDFSVSIETSLRLADQIPAGVVKISESGLSSVEAIRTLKTAGFQGFLIGEYFMKHVHPHLACTELVKDLEQDHA